jgi:pentatricopeptide repeat protein
MRKRGVDEAWNALEEMQAQGVPTDKYTISRLLMKTVGDGRSRMNTARVYRGIGLVEKFIDIQPKDVDEVLLNALLDTCCRLKDLARLESTVQRMRDLKVTPSPVTLGILVKTYGQAGDIQKVLQVWDEMESQRGQANAVTYGCMIDACVKCNRLDKAIEIFAGMRESGKHRNTILYTTMIKGYGLEKNLSSALALFREMPQENVSYNTITYNSIIDACVKGGDLATAESLLHEIISPASSLEPDLITFSTLLKGYCHAGELDKALQLAETIKIRGLHCDELVYNTLMDGCVKANDVTAGVGLFEEMIHAGMRPSTITHSILARLYQRAGYEDDSSEAVAQLYRHHGIERPIGGDRPGKGAGRRNGNQRSPLGRGGASPTASPMSGYGQNQEAYWNGWGETGYDAYSQSGASTPCGSPLHQPMGGQHVNGAFLPMDAMQQLPPLPSMDGSGTPYGSPMGGSYGSYASPCMSPTGMEQHMAQGNMMAVPQHSPSQVQYNGGMVTAPGGGAMPQMPAWPFSGPGATMGNVQQGASSGGDMVMSQFIAVQPSGVPMMQQSPGNMLPDGSCFAQGQGQNCSGSGAATPTNCAPGGSPCWQGQPAQNQQSPWGMPLSPPHDLVQPCAPSQPQQAFFQQMPDAGQASNGQMPANPFCL